VRLPIRRIAQRTGAALIRFKRIPAQAAGFVRSIRFRLTVWFLFILSLVLLGFSLFVYYRTAQDIRGYTAARLVVRLSEIKAVVTGRYHGDSGWDWSRGPESSRAQVFVLKENEVILLSTPEGEVLGAWGGLPDTLSDEVSMIVARQGAAQQAAQYSSGQFLKIDLPAGPKNTPASTYLFSPAQIAYEGRMVGWIIIGLPLDPENQLPRLAVTLGLAAAATLLAALGGGYWLASRALWPVQAITRTAQKISETDLNRRLNIHTHDELGELATTFDHMLDRLQAAFQRQRQFTADASHELRTPLSIVTLETSRALAARRSAEEYQAALRVIESENQIMTRLVEELLLLARMDAGHTHPRREPLDLSELVVDTLERYAPIAARKGIRLDAGSLPEVILSGDRQLLLQAIGNLVDNAIKYHNPPDAAQGARWVRVETGWSTAPTPSAFVRVADNGPGIAQEHLPRLFDRFYRVDDARSRGQEAGDAGDEAAIPGSGLGLSIVQWIAQAHDGQARVDSQSGAGAVFELCFPEPEQDLNLV
jgi:signal transduction histidine kinase